MIINIFRQLGIECSCYLLWAGAPLVFIHLQYRDPLRHTSVIRTLLLYIHNYSAFLIHLPLYHLPEEEDKVLL